MATDKRTFPNTYFAWYNDDNRVAIVCQDTTSVSGESTQEKYDSYQGADVATGLRITYSSKFETADAQTDNLKSDIGLDSGLHPALVCYIKSRIFEDMGDLEKAQYFRNMYEVAIRKFPDSRDPGGIIRQYFKF